MPAPRRPGTARPQPEPAPARPASGRGRPRPAASRLPTYLIGGAIVLGIAGFLAWGPVQRSIALSKLDAFIPAAPGDLPAETAGAAIAAADEAMQVLDRNRNRIEAAVIRNRGPVEARIHMAAAISSVPLLVRLAELPDATVRQRTEAIARLAAVYDRERDGRERMPADLAAWAQGGKLPGDAGQARDLARAAIALVASMQRDDAVRTLRAVAERGEDELARAAVAGLAAMAGNGDASAIGAGLSLLAGGETGRRAALAEAGFAAAVRGKVQPGHFPALAGLLGHAEEAVRVLALDGLAAPGMRLGEGAQARKGLVDALVGRLSVQTPPAELAGALRAIAALRLAECRDAVLGLLPSIAVDAGSDGLVLPGIDRAVLGNLLGDACMPPSYAKADEAERAWAAASVSAYAERLSDARQRSVLATALGRVTGSGYQELPELRNALDALARHGDPICIEALANLASKTYERADLAKNLGQDAAKWRAFLAEDKPRTALWQGWQTWYQANGLEVSRVTAGRRKLADARKTIGDANATMDAWLSDPAFVPPLGMTKGQVASFRQRMGALLMDVNRSYGGALAEDGAARPAAPGPGAAPARPRAP